MQPQRFYLHLLIFQTRAPLPAPPCSASFAYTAASPTFNPLHVSSRGSDWFKPIDSLLPGEKLNPIYIPSSKARARAILWWYISRYIPIVYPSNRSHLYISRTNSAISNVSLKHSYTYQILCQVYTERSKKPTFLFYRAFGKFSRHNIQNCWKLKELSTRFRQRIVHIPVSANVIKSGSKRRAL